MDASNTPSTDMDESTPPSSGVEDSGWETSSLEEIPRPPYPTVICHMPHISPPDISIEEDLCGWWDTVKVDFRAEWGDDVFTNFRSAIANLAAKEPPPVAFPTETVYGLGANALSEKAVRGIFEAKNRPTDNPLIVHIASLPQLRKLLGDIPADYHSLVHKFWPGPLTILMHLPKRSPFAPSVTNKLSTVGIRMPSTPVARLLISLAGVPIAAPSANTSTKPSPTTAQHVWNDMKTRINYIIDGGPCQIGLESTVVDGLCDPPQILRPGGISIEQIRACGGKWAHVKLGYSDKRLLAGVIPRAPGMKYKHYAPAGNVLLFEAGVPQEKAAMKLCYHLFHRNGYGLARNGGGQRVGVITTASWDPFLSIGNNPKFSDAAKILYRKSNTVPSWPLLEGTALPVQKRTDWPPGRYAGDFYNIDAGKTAEEVARNIYGAFREFDKLQCQLILVEGIGKGSGELAAAVMNRWRKAAET